MRQFEFILTVSLLLPIALVLPGHIRKGRLFAVALILSILVVGIHAITEGLHWQLIPLYACIPILALVFLYDYVIPRWLVRSCGIACAVFLILAIAFSYVLPMFRLPEPTGPYQIGTRLLYLIDSSRSEIHGPHPRGYRELMVQIWYPTDLPSGTLATYRRRAETTLFSSYMSLVKTHSYLDAPIAKAGAPFPVLLFNPAWKNPRTLNTFQFEDLASHGFLVASIDHTHNSQPVAFPDGRRITSSVPEISDFTHYTQQEVVDLGNQELAYQAADDRFVLNSLSKLNLDTASDYFSRLNTDDVGAFGHSFGGAVAMEICQSDPRVRAALNMDGWFFGTVAEKGLNKPLFIMSADRPGPPEQDLQSSDRATRLGAEWERQDLQHIFYTLAKFGGFYLRIQNSSHFIFSDRALYSPIRSLQFSGSVDSQVAHTIIESYTLAFFSKYLKGQNSLLLEQIPSPYPRTEFRVYSKPAN